MDFNKIQIKMIHRIKQKILKASSYYLEDVLGLRLDEIANARLCFLDKGNSFYSVSAKVSKSKRNRIVPIPKFFLKQSKA